jgi:anti-anti-sigma regulatory factor
MWMRGGLATITAAEVAPSRFLVAVGGELDTEACAALRDVLLPLAGAEGARVVLDLGSATVVDDDPVPLLVAAGTAASSTGGRLTVVTGDTRLRSLLTGSGHVVVEHRLEEQLL